MSMTIHQMTDQLNKAQEEIIELKHHVSASVDRANFSIVKHQPAQRHQIVAPPKPSVLVIGTSNVKNINETKLTDAC